VTQAKEKGKMKYAESIVDDVIGVIISELENKA
jgi:hypothetical protein